MAKKILIIDDSALMRRVLCDIIDSDERFVLADSASNGLEAYDLIVTDPKKYDILILDINMPKMNGIQLMEKMNEKNIHIPILVVSTIAKEGAVETIRCLELGAFDFITKPDSFLETKSDKFRQKIVNFMCLALSLPTEAEIEGSKKPAINVSTSAAAQPAPRPHITAPSETRTATAVAQTPPAPHQQPARVTQADQAVQQVQTINANEDLGSSVLNGPMSYVRITGFNKLPHKSFPTSAKKLVAVACSTGGPKALQQVIPKLPANLAAPVILVQHMPDGFTGTLAARLNEMSKINVKEAEDGEPLKNGTVYIAKGGRHLRIVKSGKNYVVSLGDDPARNSLRPCADIMYESLKELDFDEITCVVLTGMGSDGTRGIGQLCGVRNTYVIAQDEASSTVYGMPRMVHEAEITDEVTELNSIADAITKVVGTC